MHELSIALSLIEGVEEELAKHGSARVSVVHLRLGRLSGVAKQALLFSYDVACEGTRLQGSTLQIEDMPEGTDLQIYALELKDDDAAASC